MLAIPLVGPDEPHPEIVERDVVIARHRHPRRFEPVEEGAGLAVLRHTGALGEIAGDGNEIGTRSVHRGEQRVEQFDIGASEVQV